jgi:hypothetical protein
VSCVFRAGVEKEGTGFACGAFRGDAVAAVLELVQFESRVCLRAVQLLLGSRSVAWPVRVPCSSHPTDPTTPDTRRRRRFSLNLPLPAALTKLHALPSSPSLVVLLLLLLLLLLLSCCCYCCCCCRRHYALDRCRRRRFWFFATTSDSHWEPGTLLRLLQNRCRRQHSHAD